MTDIDELIFKVKVETDDEELKGLRDKIEAMKKHAEDNAIKLGVKSNGVGVSGEQQAQVSSQSIDTNTQKNISKTLSDSENRIADALKSAKANSESKNKNKLNNSSGDDAQSLVYSQEIQDTLTLSERHLLDILNILKSGHGGTGGGSSSSGGGGALTANLKGPMPFVQDFAQSSLMQKGGMLAGGLIGLPGGPAMSMAFAQIGGAVAGAAEQISDEVKKKMAFVAGLYSEKMAEDLHLRQLQTQTGMTSKALYQLQAQAMLAGTSLEAVVGANQDLVDQMTGGMSERQAETYMALGINPEDIYRKAGGDAGKITQMLFEASDKALKGFPAAVRSAHLSRLGITPEMQDARKYLYTPKVTAEAKKIADLAAGVGKDGKETTPFLTPAQINAERLNLKGFEAEVEAKVRSLLQQEGLAKKIAIGSLELSNATVNIYSGVINSVLGKTEREKTKEPTKEDKRIQHINHNLNQSSLPSSNIYAQHPTTTNVSKNAGVPW